MENGTRHHTDYQASPMPLIIEEELATTQDGNIEKEQPCKKLFFDNVFNNKKNGVTW